jgi:hypothetical protein
MRYDAALWAQQATPTSKNTRGNWFRFLVEFLVKKSTSKLHRLVGSAFLSCQPTPLKINPNE